MKTDSPSYSAPALDKGLDILELLAARESGLSMKAIADELGRSKSEIFRMLMVLLDRGYIARDAATDEFTLTNRLFNLGLRTPRVKDLLSRAAPILRQLAEECGHSPHLVVVHHGETVTIAAVSGGADMSFTLKLGYGRVAVDATSGQVILAFQPPEVRRHMVEESRRLLDRDLDEGELGEAFERIREQGYEMHESRDFVGITDICCPVLGGNGEAIACVIISYVNRRGRTSRHAEVLDMLRQSCRAIAEEIA
ncbi:IclR family transcriptional regulator [Labrys wisconsinensis]|uniref:DNA-binding IclR family transcriptional regulator n=1 Tax=Labrys wisconsinensis TaxID=425677 RepID=A0ABU0J966_9HYPH|nr:IclR family transcriptional regulator [Labrys wisconsinensis]MDQ0470814.1 DNA-binding IclR family transcriptional regulator [Labrys wisconsinensis]